MKITYEVTDEVPDEWLKLGTDLPDEDGEPLETPWHRSAMNLLIDIVLWFWRGRKDFFVGGNMFIHFCDREVDERRFRGPDFFLVKNVDGTRERRFWLVWQENGKYPDVIIELLSPSTALLDRTEKKDLYEQTFRTREYFCYDPTTRQVEGWRHSGRRYQPIPPNKKGWLWCEELGLWLGTWEGTFQEQQSTWPRFFDPEGNLVLTKLEARDLDATRAELLVESTRHHAQAADERAQVADERAHAAEERAKAERERAQIERQRAQAAEVENQRLKALLQEKGIDIPAE